MLERASACGVLLARRPSRLRPDPRIASRVQNRQNDHAFGFDVVEDPIRKLRKEGSAHLAVDLREHLRIALDCIKGGTDSS